MLNPFWRRLLLLVHVATSVGFIGAVAGFLALVVAGVATTDPTTAGAVYLAARILTWAVIVPLAWASLIVGIVQSLGTSWGLFRYYWVIAKLLLTVFATVVLMVQTRTIDMLAAMAAAPGSIAAAQGPRFAMILHGSGGLAVLLLITALSIYKPRGTTAVGARRTAEPRAG